MSPPVANESRLTARVRKALALPGAEWVALLEATVLLSAAEIAVRLVSLKTLLALIQRVRRVGSPSTRMSPDRLAELVEVAARHHVLRPTCLRKALVLYALLAGKGIPAALVLGVARPPSGVEAHAWVEVQGIRLGSHESERFAPLPAVPGELQ